MCLHLQLFSIVVWLVHRTVDQAIGGLKLHVVGAFPFSD